MSALEITCSNVIKHPKEDAFALVEESAAHKRGVLCLPGGGWEWDQDATIPDGAAREAFQEAGLKVVPFGLISMYHYPNGIHPRLHFIFASSVVGGELTASEEHQRVGYFPYVEIVAFDVKNILRGEAVLDSISRYRANKIQSIDQVLKTIVDGHTAEPPDIPVDLASRATELSTYDA